MMYSEAVKIREFIIKNTPAGHKARNISKAIMGKIRAEVEPARPWVYDLLDLDKPPFRDPLGDPDFEIKPEQASEMQRAYDLAVEYKKAVAV